MKVDILTLFPEMFDSPFSASIVKRAREKGLITINCTNIRDYSENKHKTVDDYPYGGGAGMVMKPEPVFNALEKMEIQRDSRVIVLCPGGETFSQQKADELAKSQHLVFLCGHYEGFDERIKQKYVTDEISVGDYILTGGELPAMVIIDAVTRLLPGVLGSNESAQDESFVTGLLEYPHYTRPASYKGMEVPQVLLSGNHEEIRKWRKREAIQKTLLRRPDLLEKVELDKEGVKMLKEVRGELTP
ncbi:tRNA (guanine37-N1)-methyltransferase [Desulfitispora alkaliphila]|uniref:tRNA (guanosine(37)-N1)-methyltransferase TrmD n=1 Tax=Desulfitispora alkaliphila TaxID=622674 RepID=UPI003D1CF462